MNADFQTTEYDEHIPLEILTLQHLHELMRLCVEEWNRRQKTGEFPHMKQAHLYLK